MMETTALGMGLMMTAVAVALGGLVLEATFLMLCRALRVPTLAASFEPAAFHLSQAERAVDVLNSIERPENCGRIEKEILLDRS